MAIHSTAGHPMPGDASVLELRVPQLRRLFNQLDPSPLGERDLDPRIEDYILDWSRELPRGAVPALAVQLERGPGPATEPGMLAEAIRQYYRRRAAVSRVALRRLLRSGRFTLAIGISFLVLALLTSRWITENLQPGGALELLTESLVIGGWVALWRPIEILLYDWWPVLGEARLYDRLAAMPVQLRYLRGQEDESWRGDWPAIEEGGGVQAT